jgi:hypothetical protein
VRFWDRLFYSVSLCKNLARSCAAGRADDNIHFKRLSIPTPPMSEWRIVIGSNLPPLGDMT